MNFIPKWITQSLNKEKITCRKCQNLFTTNNIRALGIRHSIKNFEKESLFIEFNCKNCKELMIFEFVEMSLVDLSMEVLQEMNETEEENDISIKDNRKKIDIKTKITLKEKNDDIKFLKKVKSNEEFLMAMGLSPDEIEEYNNQYKKDK